MGSVLWPDANVAAKPGGFVRTVVACSVMAPLVSLTVSLWMRLRMRSANVGAALIAARSLAGALATLGATMAISGALNQIVRQPPLMMDLTMRAGNGGFVALEILLLAIGLSFRYHAMKEHAASERRVPRADGL